MNAKQKIKIFQNRIFVVFSRGIFGNFYKSLGGLVLAAGLLFSCTGSPVSNPLDPDTPDFFVAQYLRCIMGLRTCAGAGGNGGSGPDAITQDINGDGYDDIVVGANNYAGGQGRVYIFLGSASGIANKNASAADTILTGEVGTGRFGTSVSLGDVNGDGFADVIVGANQYSSNQGRVYIFHGSASGIANKNASAADTILTGETTSNYFGISVFLGDVNGDGYDDAIVGASYNSSYRGRAYLFYGSASGIASQDLSGGGTADTTLTGEGGTDQFGYSVSLGDANGDGFADAIVGAIGVTATFSNQGRAYIFYGGASGIASQDLSSGGTADTILTGEALNNNFGKSVSFGDANGDGFADAIVGATGAGSFSNQGRAYIFYGSASGIASQDLSGSGTADTTLTGEAPNNYFGASVFFGDVNGDGFADAISGAYGNSSNKGRAYIFLGSASGIASNNASVADTTLTGTGSEKLGGAASFGDANGDGFADAIVGASFYNTSLGHAYIFYGSASGIASQDLSGGGTADTTLTGEATPHSFGYAVR